MHVLFVCACDSQVQSGAAALLADKMRGVHLSETYGRGPEVILFCMPGVPVEQQPAVLRAQIAILQGMTIESLTHLVVLGYTLTKALVAELANLPQWETALLLGRYELGTDGIAALSSLAEHVPTCYQNWGLEIASSKAEHIMAVCVGVMKHRAAGLPPLSLLCLPDGAGEQRLGGHVTLKQFVLDRRLM